MVGPVQLSGEKLLQLRLKSYREIATKIVSENVMSQFMYKTLPNSNQLWIFKRQFATQLALSSVVSFLMLIGGRAPNKILFARTTGKVFQNDFHPGQPQAHSLGLNGQRKTPKP